VHDKVCVVPLTDTANQYRERALQALSDLPPFSPVLDRLLATLSNEGVSISRVSEIIENDTVIAGNVLKVVNSALYGRRGTVNSIRHAVSLLGINKLRNAGFAMSITRVWNSARTAPGWSTARFNQRSVACGLLCDCLSQRLPIAYPEGAFVAGLFHDLGQLLIAVSMHEEYLQIQDLLASEFGSVIDCERKVIGISHADLSADALAVWNLPAAIQQAVRFHHAPQNEPKDPVHGKFGLALAIACSEAYSDLTATSQTRQPADDQPLQEPFAPLGITSDKTEFLNEYQTELDALAGVFR
jgi:HD-like signal output (HDOD) protein